MQMDEKSIAIKLLMIATELEDLARDARPKSDRRN